MRDNKRQGLEEVEKVIAILTIGFQLELAIDSIGINEGNGVGRRRVETVDRRAVALYGNVGLNDFEVRLVVQRTLD